MTTSKTTATTLVSSSTTHRTRSRRSLRIVGAELRKLVSTRSGVILLCAPIVYPAAMVATATTDGPDLEVDAIEVLRGTGDVLPVVWLLVGALAIAGEFGDGSIVSTLISVPRRSVLVVAKLAALAVAALCATAASVVVALGSAATREPNGWLDSVTVGDLVRTGSALFAVALLFALTGGSVGAVARHPTVASVAILVWMLVAENVLPAALGIDGATRWMSSRAAGSLVDVARPEPGAIGAGAGLAVLAGVAVVAGAVALVLFENRDVAG